MKSWITYAFLSMIFAGFTSVIAKTGLSGVSGEVGLAVRTVFIFLLVCLFSVIVIPPDQWSALSRDNYLWLGLSGLTTFLSWLFYYKALKEGEVATIAVIDKGSIVIAILLAYFFLKEQITLKVATGAVLMITGLLIIARR